MQALEGHGPLAELVRLAADIEHVVERARRGEEPRSTPEFVAAANVVPLARSRIGTLVVGPAADDMEPQLSRIASSFRDLRQFILTTTGPVAATLAEIYSPDVELELATVSARTRVAKAIRTARQHRGLTLRQVADAVGATASYVSQLEFGRTLPTPDRAERLDGMLNLNGGSGSSLVEVLTDLRRTRDEIRRELGQIRRVTRSRSRSRVSDPRLVPSQAIDALEEWRGRWEFNDLHALNLIAWQPQMRELVFTIGHLPQDVQVKALDFLKSLGHRRLEPARLAPTDVGMDELWKSQRALVDPANWALSTLLLELRAQFDPFTDISRSPDALTAALADLDRREFDAMKVVRGPVLRRTARLIVERLRVNVARVADERRLPDQLQDWIAENAAETSLVLSSRLWAYWGNLSPVEAQALPAPKPTLIDASPELDPFVEWFVIRLTEERLRNWPAAALEFEAKVQYEGVRVPPPWSAAAELRVIDPSDVIEERQRRARTSRSVAEREIPSEFVAHSLLASGYESFVEGRRDEAEAFARAAVERYPTVGAAYNDLGFILMVAGQFSEALIQFNRAEQLDFEQHELLDFNIACCHTMLRQYERGLDGFRSALSNPTEGAILGLIDGADLSAVHLETASHYVAAAALNAGWAAAHLGKTELAREYLRIAARGTTEEWGEEVKLGQTSGADAFEQSRRHLEGLVGE